MKSLFYRIKRAETPLYASIKKIALMIRKGNIPSISFIHKPLYILHTLIRDIVSLLYHNLWINPLFRTRCSKVGNRLVIHNGMPYVQGPLDIILGNDVTILQCTLASGYHDENFNPTLIVGNNSTIGHGTTISCSKRVTIGDNVLIAGQCFIADNSGHPINPQDRTRGLPVTSAEISPVTIGNNVWIGSGARIMKGVKIGDNVIVGANVVVTRSIPKDTMLVTPEPKVFRNYPRFFKGVSA